MRSSIYRLRKKFREHGARGVTSAVGARMKHFVSGKSVALIEGSRRLPFRAIVALLGALRIRFLAINFPERIGHLAIEPDCYIKEGVLGRRPSFRTLWVVSRSKIANLALLAHWRRYLKIIDHPYLSSVLGPLVSQAELRYETHAYTVAINETARYVEIQNEWQGRPPLLQLTDSEVMLGWSLLEEMGVPRGSWFVAVHCREPGYVHDPVHDFRDADIETYLSAIRAIVERGGWCIRMGDPSMKPLPVLKGVIDYVHRPQHSEAMDIFLCAAARFFLANTSGLYTVGSIFGVPAACANMAPMSALSYSPNNIDIPKLVYSETQERYLTFQEIFASPVANYRFSYLYKEAGLRVEQNSDDDIRDLATEMLDRLEGRAQYTESDEVLQRKFKALFQPGHYAFGAKTRIGREFLRKYKHLIGNGLDTR